MTNDKAALRKDNAELRTNCYDVQWQLFDAGRDIGLKTKTSRDAGQAFCQYESRASEHIRSLLLPCTEVADKHVGELAHLSERQQEHAASMLQKLKASQEETQYSLGARGTVELEHQLLQVKMTVERGLYDDLIFENDAARLEREAIVLNYRSERVAIMTENQDLVDALNVHRSEIEEAKIEKQKLEAYILGMSNSTVAGSRVTPSFAGGTNFVVGVCSRNDTNLGRSSDANQRYKATFLRGMETNTPVAMVSLLDRLLRLFR